MSHTIAHLLVDILHAAGVRRIYGVAGDSLNGITDALRSKGTIDWIHTRHEETAAFAAGAEAQLPGVFETAIRIAVAERGVSVIVLPGDVALKETPSCGRFSRALLPARPLMRPREPELDALAEMLNDSSRVTLLCGRGCLGAHDKLVQLAKTLKSPIVHALGGKEAVEYDNPYDVGMTGLIGFSSGYHAMMDCDTLLMLGPDFPYRQFYPVESKIAQIDLRAENLGRRC